MCDDIKIATDEIASGSNLDIITYEFTRFGLRHDGRIRIRPVNLCTLAMLISKSIDSSATGSG